MPKKRDDDDEPNVWITALKLLIGAIVLIGGTGFLLWYADKMQDKAELMAPKPSGGVDWGISSDSPIRPRR